MVFRLLLKEAAGLLSSDCRFWIADASEFDFGILSLGSTESRSTKDG
jgi:hypothetical protein